MKIIPNRSSAFYDGFLSWLRADITMETSTLSYMMALSREGHLKKVFQMCDFLKGKHNSLMVLGPTNPDIDLSEFLRKDWMATIYLKF